MKLKHNIANHTNDTEQLSPVLDKLKHEVQGFKVPDGYFDSLSPRIVDGIRKKENTSFLNSIVPQFRKPLLWKPLMIATIAAVMLFLVKLPKDQSSTPTADDWTEINMAYDASYAEETVLAESNTIDREIENSEINYTEGLIFTGQNELTNDEITNYLEEHELDNNILNEY